MEWEKNPAANDPHFVEDDRDVFDGAHILGYDPDGYIILWYRGALSVLKDRELTPIRWHLLTGQHYTKEEFKDCRYEIVSTAHSRGILYQDSRMGTGIWKINETFYLINGDEIIVFDSITKTFFSKTLPIVQNKIIAFNSDKWLNLPSLPSSTNGADSKIDLHKAFEDLHKIVKKWNFFKSEMAKYLTAFIMLAPVSAAMKWRPLVYLLGKRGVGKTTFLDLLSNLWGPLATRLDKASAFSVAQTVGNTTKIPILDEFENDRHIQNILNMLKNTNGEAGGTITRGTITKQANVYHLQQMFWLASIYEASLDAAIESRMALFPMVKASGILDFPTSEILTDLRHRIIASVLPMWPEIERVAAQYRANKKNFKVQDGRLVDNYAYAAAVVDLAGFEGGMPDYLESSIFEEDENMILDAILDSKIKYINFEGSIAEALTEENNLEAFGLKKITHKGVEYLAIKTDMVTRLLLKDTRWGLLDIRAPLERVPESLKSVNTKLNGRVVRCVAVPWKFLGFDSDEA